MKSKMSLRLATVNNDLKRSSWDNYRLFLDKLLRTLDWPFARSMHALLRAKDYRGLLEFADSLTGQQYTCAAEHFAANQLASLVRKYPYPSSVITLGAREAAIKKFWKSEHYCARINQRFRAFNKRNPYSSTLERASRWIGYVLGALNLQDVYDECGWGPGASVGVHGNATNFGRKILSSSWSVSPGALLYARSAMIKNQHYMELLLKPHMARFFPLDNSLFNERFAERCSVVHYNKITFVPKTAKIERTIAVEPLLNGFVQKGVDNLMRKKLKRVGLNLHDQTANQELARQGSLPKQLDPYVTIDLSSASDGISIGLCRYMLPPEWFDFLNSLRSKRFRMNGVEYTYHKFTSMGNGFCFPLETLLFASLCASIYDEMSLKHDFRVYGDDIIVRQSAARKLLDILRVCGFRVNTDKTFLQGPFRESCGADWFEGKDVRPVSLDYAFDSIENIFKFCNIVGQKELTASFFAGSLEFLHGLIPKDLFFVRPFKGNVDTALEVPFDVFLTSPFANYNRKIMTWSWVEVQKSGVGDSLLHRYAGFDTALMEAALRGNPSHQPFTVRRNTCTKFRKVSYAGASSTATVSDLWRNPRVVLLGRHEAEVS